MKKIIIIISILGILISSEAVFAKKKIAKKPKADVAAFGMLKNGQQEPVAKIIVEEFLTQKIFALLNYVFFDPGSADIPPRYHVFKSKSETERFNPERQFLNYETLDVYYDVLNVVGYRLRNNPDEIITLTGCNSNTGEEAGNTELSRKRAESVKKYLTSIWDIEPKRIQIAEPRNLPEKPSLSKTEPALSDEENRRVEIAGSWNMIKPLIINDTLRTSNPPAIIFKTNVKAADKLKNWKLTVQQDGDDLRRPFTGKGEPRKVITWRINKYKDEMPRGDAPLVYRLYAFANLRGKSEMKKLPVKEMSVETKKRMRSRSKEYSRYNLILFDFNSKELSENNRLIMDLIKDNDKLTDSTTFYVTGYTDLIGTKEANMKLSLERANEAGKKLVQLGFSDDQIKIKGLGGATSPYYQSAIDQLAVARGEYVDPDFATARGVDDEQESEDATINYNKLPEGRLYCRTVVIELENEVQYGE